MDTTAAPIVHARERLEELFRRPGFEIVRQTASIALVGSWCNGLADAFSDVDVFLYVPDDRYPAAVAAAVEDELVQPGGDWTVWYRKPYDVAFKVWAMRELHEEIVREPVIAASYLKKAEVWQDPGGQFGAVVDAHMASFAATMPGLIKSRSHWLRMRIKHAKLARDRGLAVTTDLVRADFIRGLYEISFLLEGAPFCHLKWLEARSTAETELGRTLQPVIKDILAADAYEPMAAKMREAYLLTREVAIRRGAQDPTLTNPQGDIITRVFEADFL